MAGGGRIEKLSIQDKYTYWEYGCHATICNLLFFQFRQYKIDFLSKHTVRWLFASWYCPLEIVCELRWHSNYLKHVSISTLNESKWWLTTSYRTLLRYYNKQSLYIIFSDSTISIFFLDCSFKKEKKQPDVLYNK